MTTPEAGRVEEACAHLQVKYLPKRVGDYWHSCWECEMCRAEFVPLTTQAETIRQCDKELAEFREDLFKQAETIRRLEGEVASLRSNFHVTTLEWKQRAEAAEGLRPFVEKIARATYGSQALAEEAAKLLAPDMTFEEFRASPATGEGA